MSTTSKKRNLFSELFCQTISIQKAPSKIIRYGLCIPNEIVYAVPYALKLAPHSIFLNLQNTLVSFTLFLSAKYYPRNMPESRKPFFPQQ